VSRVVLVTGVTQGIGRFLARRFVASGDRVFGCARTEWDAPEPGVAFLRCDVREEPAVGRVMGEIRSEAGGLDILINGAGVASMNHALLTPGATARRIIDTNYFGTFLMCREAARLMARHRGGRIVNFSTVAVPLDLEGEAVYASSKAAIESLTRILAKELAGLGIRVNAIGPTPIETRLIAGVPEATLSKLLERQAIPRLGTFEDVENVVRFLTAAESEFITGQIIYLGGVMK
jgi:3-oxoacyl-[acyl-carrier protein] reductase